MNDAVGDRWMVGRRIVGFAERDSRRRESAPLASQKPRKRDSRQASRRPMHELAAAKQSRQSASVARRAHDLAIALGDMRSPLIIPTFLWFSRHRETRCY